MEAEMVEPDRTIMIVSIIGLVVIWGSFFYHKFVQGGNGAMQGAGEAESGLKAPATAEEDPIAEAQTGDAKRKGKKKKKR